MKVAFRADASIEMGSGHVMRCLTLADEPRRRGALVSFVSRELPGNLNRLIEARGFAVHRLPSSGDDSTISLPAVIEGGWLIIDHYAIGREWEASMRPHVKGIMVIDDLAKRAHECDILLDQNFHFGAPRRYEGLLPAGACTLLGPGYALVRQEFVEARQRCCRGRGPLRIFVCFGGSDPKNATSHVLRAIRALGRDNLAVDVVIGAANPHRRELEALMSCPERGDSCCHVDPGNLGQLMAAADFSVTSGGGLTWERYCVGLPGMVIAISDNQEAVSRELGELGTHVYLGRLEDVSADSMARKLEEYLDHPEWRGEMGEKCQKLVDGQGACRVADILLGWF